MEKAVLHGLLQSGTRSVVVVHGLLNAVMFLQNYVSGIVLPNSLLVVVMSTKKQQIAMA